MEKARWGERRERSAAERRARHAQRVAEEHRQKPLLERGVDVLECTSVRVQNCLANAGIDTIGDLCAKSPVDLLGVKNFGLKSLWEVVEALEDHGLGLQGNTRFADAMILVQRVDGHEMGYLAQSTPDNEVVDRLILIAQTHHLAPEAAAGTYYITPAWSEQGIRQTGRSRAIVVTRDWIEARLAVNDA